MTEERVNVLIMDVTDTFDTSSELLIKITDNIYVIKPGIQVVAVKQPVSADILIKALMEHTNANNTIPAQP